LVQGSATNGSIGIFIDMKGSNRYMCTNNGPHFAEEEDGIGIMIIPEVDITGK